MPYAPGIQYTGDRLLFTGLADLGRSIGTALRTRDQRSYEAGLRREELKQRDVDLASDEAKKAKATRTFLSTWLPENKDQFESMGLAELEGTTRALAQRQLDQERGQRMEVQALNAAAVRDAAARRDHQDRATAGFLSDLASFQDLAQAGPDGEPAMILAPEVRSLIQRPGGIGLAALARNPGIAPGDRERVLSSLLAPSVNLGQTFDLANGVQAVRVGPNRLQVVHPEKAVTDESTVEITEKTGNKPSDPVVKRKLTEEKYAAYVQAQEEAKKKPVIAGLLKRRAELRGKLAAGNRYAGPEAAWLPAFGDRKEQLGQVEEELRNLGYVDAEEPAGSPPPKPAFNVGQTNAVNGVRITRTK